MKSEAVVQTVITAILANVAIDILLSYGFKILNFLHFSNPWIQDAYKDHNIAIRIVIFIVMVVIFYMFQLTKKDEDTLREIKGTKF